MIRAVLDANVFASGVFGLERDASTPGAILRAWEARAFELVTSDPLIAEVERTLANPFFAPRIPAARVAQTVAALRQNATRTSLTARVAGVASHPEDDLVLAAAVSAQADVLVTGDAQIQRLEHYRGVGILSPRDFLALLDEQGAFG